MKKVYINSFSIHQSYKTKDIVRLLGITPRTVGNWVGKGLVPIVPNSNPLVFTGENIKLFLKQSSASKKCPLKKHEFYCFKCKDAVIAKEKSIKIIGHIRHALCKKCGGKVCRGAGKQSEKIRAP